MSLILGEGYLGYDAAVLLYAGAPFAGAVGVMIANFRAFRVFQSPAASLWLPGDVELRARYTMHAFLFNGHPYAEHEPMGALTESEKRRRRLNAARQLNEGPSDLENGPGKASHLNRRLRSQDDSNDGSADAEAQGAAIRGLLSSDQLAEIENILTTGCTSFMHSSTLHLCVARYYTHLFPNNHLQLTYLLRATRLSPGLDAKFFILQSRRQAEEATEEQGRVRQSATSRLAFDTQLGQVRALVLHALKSRASFWSMLQAPALDLGALHSVADEMSDVNSAAERAFASLLALNSQSLTAIRLYADFTLYVCNNGPKVRQTRVNVHSHSTFISSRIVRRLTSSLLMLRGSKSCSVESTCVR